MVVVAAATGAFEGIPPAVDIVIEDDFFLGRAAEEEDGGDEKSMME